MFLILHVSTILKFFPNFRIKIEDKIAYSLKRRQKNSLCSRNNFCNETKIVPYHYFLLPLLIRHQIFSTACFCISLFWNSIFQQQKDYYISSYYQQQEPVVLRVGRAPKENGVPYVCSSIYLLIYLSNVLAAYKMYQLNIIQMYEQHTKRINQIFIECTSSVQNVFNFEQFYNWT